MKNTVRVKQRANMKVFYILLIILTLLFNSCGYASSQIDGGNISELNGTYDYTSIDGSKICTLADFNNCACNYDCIEAKCGNQVNAIVASISGLKNVSNSHKANGYFTTYWYKTDCSLFSTNKCTLEIDKDYSEFFPYDIPGEGKDCIGWQSIYSYSNKILTLDWTSGVGTLTKK